MPSAAAQDVLQAILERRAAEKRREMTAAGPGVSTSPAAPVSLPFADRWHNSLANRILSAPSKLFGGLVVDPAIDAMTLAGDVYAGRQPTMAFDPQTGETGTDPGLMGRAGNMAGAMTLGAGAIPAETNALRMGIKAYHGSPHDFERFDSSKIGTGEGAQAYGHGLYFAENEGVARSYKPGANATYRANDVVKGHVASALKSAYKAGLSGQEAKKEALRYLQEYADNAGQSARRQEFHDAINNFDALSDLGKMYEVDIAADPEHFLDWDKPLSEQPKAIQDAMVTPEGQALSDKLDAVIVEKNALAGDRDPKTNMMRNEKRWHELAREADRLQGELSKVVTADMKGGYAHLTLGGGAESARRLREAGIPGIRYLDQGSRDPQKMKELADDLAQYKEAAKHWAETGNSEKLAIAQKQIEVLTKRISETRNYVVFPGNEHLIAILKKYGLPISAAGLAALSQLHPEEAQAAQQQNLPRY